MIDRKHDYRVVLHWVPRDVRCVDTLRDAVVLCQEHMTNNSIDSSQWDAGQVYDDFARMCVARVWGDGRVWEFDGVMSGSEITDLDGFRPALPAPIRSATRPGGD